MAFDVPSVREREIVGRRERERGRGRERRGIEGEELARERERERGEKYYVKYPYAFCRSIYVRIQGYM